MKICPICGWEGDFFLPCNPNYADDESRQLAHDCKCPQCHSHHRHRGVQLILQQCQLPRADSRMLHIAPENFLTTYFAQKTSKYIKIDKHPENYPSTTVTEMDLTQLSFADDSFDFVFCSHVLEHIPDDRKAMREIYRVLAPQGIAILMVPIYPLAKTADLYPKSPDIMTHVHQPGLDYFQRYRQAGFAVKIYYPEKLFDAEKYGLRKGWDPVAICYKGKNFLQRWRFQWSELWFA